VIIARPELRPADFADKRLFVHMDNSPPPVSTGAAPAIEKPIKTAQAIDDATAVDAKPGDVASGIVLRRTIGPDAPTQIAGEPILPMATEAPPDGKPAATETPAATPIAEPQVAPAPAPKPSDMAIRRTPISIFVSTKDKKIYVRQDFTPLFSAPITIERPDQHFGTHVFTAMDYLDDHSSFRWNVVTLPGEPPKTAPKGSRQAAVEVRYVRGKRVEENVAPPPVPTQMTPQAALAGIEIPQDIIERISQLIIPGSSLIISDHGIGEETGVGTDFIIVTR
jgi:hypothetical protein